MRILCPLVLLHVLLSSGACTTLLLNRTDNEVTLRCLDQDSSIPNIYADYILEDPTGNQEPVVIQTNSSSGYMFDVTPDTEVIASCRSGGNTSDKVQIAALPVYNGEDTITVSVLINETAVIDCPFIFGRLHGLLSPYDIRWVRVEVNESGTIIQRDLDDGFSPGYVVSGTFLLLPVTTNPDTRMYRCEARVRLCNTSCTSLPQTIPGPTTMLSVIDILDTNQDAYRATIILAVLCFVIVIVLTIIIVALACVVRYLRHRISLNKLSLNHHEGTHNRYEELDPALFEGTEHEPFVNPQQQGESPDSALLAASVNHQNTPIVYDRYPNTMELQRVPAYYDSQVSGVSAYSGLSGVSQQHSALTTHKMPEYSSSNYSAASTQADTGYYSSCRDHSEQSLTAPKMPTFSASDTSSSSKYSHISDKTVLTVMDYLMHNKNCQIPNCPCHYIQERYQKLVAGGYPDPELRTENFNKNISTHPDIIDRKSRFQLAVADTELHNPNVDNLHPHFHRTYRYKRRPMNLSLTPVTDSPYSSGGMHHMSKSQRHAFSQHLRSKSLSDLSPVEEVSSTLAATPQDSHNSQNGSSPECFETKAPPLLREMSLSADNLPALCLNDCPFTPSPPLRTRRILGTTVKSENQQKLSSETTKLPLKRLTLTQDESSGYETYETTNSEFENKREKTAKLKLEQHVHKSIYSRTITFTNEGGSFNDQTHGFCLNVPKDSITNTLEDEKVVEIAIDFCFGTPLKFPPGKRPVSPIVRLCMVDNPQFRFLKPVEITIPHCVDITDEEDVKQLQFVKSGHNQYCFHETDGKEVFEPQKNHGTLKIDHFCYFCIVANKTIDCSKIKYCVVKVIPRSISSPKWNVSFCVTYLLPTCLESLKKQFSSDDVDVRTLHTFNFPGTSPDGTIEISFRKDVAGGWCLALETCRTICASEVEFWSVDCEILQLLEKERQYPPRFVLMVSGVQAHAVARVQISFSGTTKQLDTDLILEPVTSSFSPASGRDIKLYDAPTMDRNPSCISTGLSSEPSHLDLMNKVAAEVPTKWRDIGLQLGLAKSQLDIIELNHPRDSHTCFSTVFHIWKRQMTRPYRWSTIIEALKAPLVCENRLAENLSHEFPVRDSSWIGSFSSLPLRTQRDSITSSQTFSIHSDSIHNRVQQHHHTSPYKTNTRSTNGITTMTTEV